MTNRELAVSTDLLPVCPAAWACAARLWLGGGFAPGQSSGQVRPTPGTRPSAPKATAIFPATRKSSGQAGGALLGWGRSNKRDPDFKFLKALRTLRDPIGTSLGPPLDPLLPRKSVRILRIWPIFKEVRFETLSCHQTPCPAKRQVSGSRAVEGGDHDDTRGHRYCVRAKGKSGGSSMGNVRDYKKVGRRPSRNLLGAGRGVWGLAEFAGGGGIG